MQSALDYGLIADQRVGTRYSYSGGFASAIDAGSVQATGAAPLLTSLVVDLAVDEFDDSFVAGNLSVTFGPTAWRFPATSPSRA